MTTADVPGLDRLGPRDREYVESIEDPRRQEIVVSTILRYQRPDRLRAGDPLPDLTLSRLDGGGTARLDELLRERPLVLVFGSFT